MKFTRHATSPRAAAVATVAAVLALSASGCTAATPSHPTCTDHRVAVTLPTGTTQRIDARLCVPAGPARAVELLLPDRTTPSTASPAASPTASRTAWTDRRGPGSWVWMANRANLATLAVDLPRKPAGDAGTIAHQADEAGAVTHQLVGVLRRGGLGATFRRVVLVGQGAGGSAAWREAAGWTDVDALVLLGPAPAAQPVGGQVSGQVRARVLLVAGEPLDGECARSFPAAGWCGVYVEPGAGTDVLAGPGAASMSMRVSGWVTQAVGPLPAARTGCAYPCPARTES